MAPPLLDEPIAANAADEKLRAAGLNIDVFLLHSRQLQFDDPPLGRAINVRRGPPRHRGPRISGDKEKRHWFRFRQDFSFFGNRTYMTYRTYRTYRRYVILGL